MAGAKKAQSKKDCAFDLAAIAPATAAHGGVCVRVCVRSPSVLVNHKHTLKPLPFVGYSTLEPQLGVITGILIEYPGVKVVA